MAPRVVVRQAQGSVAASAVGAVHGAQAVQRQWQAAKPAPATAEPVVSAAGLMSGHRRGTTDGGDDGASRPTRPAVAGVDVDRLIEAIEDRVMAEIERRGGRYTGMF